MSKNESAFNNARGELEQLIRRCSEIDYANWSGGVLENNFKKWSSRRFTDKYRLDHVEGVLQHTSVFGEYKVKMFEELEKHAGSETFSSAAQALVSWSTPTSHLAGPSEDTSRSREEAGLKAPSKDYLDMLAELVRRCVRYGQHSAVHLRAKSHCGAPSFTVGKEAKHFIFKKTMDNLNDVIRLTEQRKFRELMIAHSIMPVFSSGVRIQADNVKIEDGKPKAKKRPCFSTKAYETQDFSEHNIVYMDYQVDPGVFGPYASQLIAARSRMMFSLSYGLNSVLQIMQNYLYNGFKTFCKNIDYKGPDVLSAQIRKFYDHPDPTDDEKVVVSDRIVALDKAQFDTTMSPEALEVMCNVLEEEKFFGSFVKVTLELPVLINMLKKGESRPICSRPDFPTIGHTSFKSGHGLVAFIGKLLGMTDALMELKNLLGPAFDLERILQNEHPDCMLFNSGDDTLFVFADANLAVKFRQMRRVGVHKDEVEDRPIFLGYYYTEKLWFKDAKKLVETLTGNERGSFGKTNQLLGFGASITEYRRCPETGIILETTFRLYRDINGVDFEKLVTPYMDKIYSSADALFINNPEAVFYKLDPDEVSEELLAEEFEFVKPEFFGPIFDQARETLYAS